MKEFCVSGAAVQYAVAKPVEVAVTESVSFNDLNFIIGALNEAVGVRTIKRVKYRLEPVKKSGNAILEFR